MAVETPAGGIALGPPVRTTVNVVSQLVKVAFLIRLTAVLAAVIGLVGTQLTVQVLLAVLLLAGSSFVGLSQPRALATVIRHPAIAMADLVAVLAVCRLLGVQSPLTLGMLSTALLVGVLFPLHVSVLLAVTLVAGYAYGALMAMHAGTDLGFFLVLGMPATLLCLVGLGQSVRRVQRAQRLAESRLAAVLQASAVSDERARLAREVHDSLAKSLQGLAFGAAALPSWVERDANRAQAEARALAQGATAAVQEARTLLTRMRTDEPCRPFDEVLGSVVRAWSEQHGNPVDFAADEVTGLDADARYELLAAVRESLENVHRHAPGSVVAVTLRASRRSALVSVSDQGPGFDPDMQQIRETAGHFGLRGMSERLESIGGRARVESRPGRGTTVWLTAPLTDPHLLLATLPKTLPKT